MKNIFKKKSETNAPFNQIGTVKAAPIEQKKAEKSWVSESLFIQGGNAFFTFLFIALLLALMMVTSGRSKYSEAGPLTEDKLVYIFRTKSAGELKALNQHSSEEFNVLLYNKSVMLDTSTSLEHNGNHFYIIDNISDFEELQLNVNEFVETFK